MCVVTDMWVSSAVGRGMGIVAMSPVNGTRFYFVVIVGHGGRREGGPGELGVQSVVRFLRS